MKNFLFMVVITMITACLLTMCKKESHKQISAQELKEEYAIIFPDLQYTGDEEPTAPAGKGGKKKAAESVLVTVFYDLNAEITGGVLTGDVSANAYHAGGQKFIDTTTTDGAKGLWACGKFYASPPGAGVTTSCPTEGSGYYRVYSADFTTYDVHLSYFKAVE